MNARLLLVEDDEDDVLFLTRALKGLAAPYGLRVAHNGLQAITALSEKPAPTHVLLDLKLPEKSGFEVLEWIRGEPALAGLRVAILTSSSEESDIRRAEELRAEGFFVKPMSLARLQDVARAIDGWVRSPEPPGEMLRVERTPKP